MHPHAGRAGLRKNRTRNQRACGFLRSSNTRTKRQRIAGPRRPTQRQRANQADGRRGGSPVGVIACIAVSLVKAPSEMSGFVLLGVGLVSSNVEPDTALAAKPSRTARSLGPHVQAGQQGRTKHAFNAKWKV